MQLKRTIKIISRVVVFLVVVLVLFGSRIKTADAQDCGCMVYHEHYDCIIDGKYEICVRFWTGCGGGGCESYGCPPAMYPCNRPPAYCCHIGESGEEEAWSGAACEPSGGDCMQIGPDGNYLYLGYDYQANSIVYNESVRCVCRIWLEDHYLCYQEHCVPNYHGTAANWVSTGENCPCPADSCGVCSVACGSGTKTCGDGYSSWEMPCNLQACDPSCTLSLEPAAVTVAWGEDISFVASVSDIKDGTVERVSFSSSDSSVANVAPGSDTSVVYQTTANGKTEGTVTVTAEAIMNGVVRCSDTSALELVSPGPWWQVKDSEVMTNGNLVSDVPLGKYFGLDGTGGYPGVVVYGESTDLLTSRISSKGCSLL